MDRDGEGMKWTVEFSREEVEAIAKAVSIAFVDREDRASVVRHLFEEVVKKGQFQ
jgi:hypothetical protein